MQKFFVLFMGLLLGSVLVAADPAVLITGKDTYNGYATVAGRLAGIEATASIRVSVRCGSTIYTTVPDYEGRWAIVFRHLCTSFLVTASDQHSPKDLLWESEERF